MQAASRRRHLRSKVTSFTFAHGEPPERCPKRFCPAEGVGSRVQGSGLQVKVSGLGFRVWGVGFRVYGVCGQGLRVQVSHPYLQGFGAGRSASSLPKGLVENKSGDTTPCRMTGVTLHSHVRYNEI